MPNLKETKDLLINNYKKLLPVFIFWMLGQASGLLRTYSETVGFWLEGLVWFLMIFSILYVVYNNIIKNEEISFYKGFNSFLDWLKDELFTIS